jgi:hypothetical protein
MSENKLADIIWRVARQELCTMAHKKDAKCIVVVTEPDVQAVAKALLADADFLALVKTLA